MLEQEHFSQTGRAKALERSQKNLADKLKAESKASLYPTPQLIERAREVMGSIDFDPTSDPVQQVLVDDSSTKYSQLPQENWHGNVWVSPKGAVRDCRLWLNKTINEYRNGYTTALSSSVVRQSCFVLHLLFGITLSVFLSPVKQLRATANGFESVSPST